MPYALDRGRRGNMARRRIGEGLDPRDPGEPRMLTSFTLSEEARALLTALAGMMKVPRTIILEILIRERAKKEGIRYRRAISYGRSKGPKPALV